MTDQEQLKEVYDELDKEQAEKDAELKLLKNEIKSINTLLDSYCVPKSNGNRLLTTAERVYEFISLSAATA